MKAYVIAAVFCCASTFAFGQTPASEPTDSVYHGSVDSIAIEPQFPGGVNAMYSFVGSNINYPQMARDNGITGTVMVSFVVQADGSISDAQIIRGIGAGCDEEVMRVIGLFPNWIPGTMNGKPVAVEYTMPVKFSIDNNPGKKKRKKKGDD